MSTVTIVSATWGPADVTKIVDDAVKAGATELLLENPTFGGDPAFGDHKVLKVTYSLDGGATTKEVTGEEWSGPFLFTCFV